MISTSPKVSRAELTRLWNAGKSCVEIARTLGVAESTVRNLRKAMALPDRVGIYTQHTTETVNDVKKHWGEGQSASQIAKRMGEGWTRNMVIGIVYRAGLSKGGVRPTRSRTPKPPRAPRPVAPPKPKSDSTPAQRAEKAAAGRAIIKKLDDVANDNAVLLIERKFGQCAWPVGKPAHAAEQLACGAPIYAGIEKCSYCLGHAQRAFARDITLPKPKESLERISRRWAA